MTSPLLPDYTAAVERARRRDAFVDYLLASARHRSIDDLPSTPYHAPLARAVMTGDHAAFKSAASAFLDADTAPTVLARLTKWTTPATVGAPIIGIPDAPLGDFVAEGQPAPNVVLTVSPVVAEHATMRFLITVDARTVDDSARAKAAISKALALAIARAEDNQLLGDAAAIVNIRPKGLRLGAPVVSASGTTAAEIGNAIAGAAALVKDGHPAMLVAIAAPGTLAWLAATGSVDATIDTLAGMPLILSASTPPSLVVIVDPTAIATTDGGLMLEASSAASADLSAVPAPGGPQISMFQVNALSIRIQRAIWWVALGATPVAVADLGLAGS